MIVLENAVMIVTARLLGFQLIPESVYQAGYMNNGMIDDYTGDMPEIFWNLTGSSN